MTRYRVANPTPEGFHDIKAGGRLCDMPCNPVWRAAAAAALIAAFGVFVCWLAQPAISALVDAASAGPAACAHVAVSDRSACVAGEW